MQIKTEGNENYLPLQNIKLLFSLFVLQMRKLKLWILPQIYIVWVKIERVKIVQIISSNSLDVTDSLLSNREIKLLVFNAPLNK